MAGERDERITLCILPRPGVILRLTAGADRSILSTLGVGEGDMPTILFALLVEQLKDPFGAR